MSKVPIRTLLPIVILVFSLFVATYQLTESPKVWYDEGFFIQAAMNVAERGEQVMRLGPTSDLSSWSISAGYPLILPIAVSFSLFGEGVLAARGVVVMYLMLFLVASYVFARRQWDTNIASFSLSLLATFPLLYGNGKAVLGEVPALFYFILTLLSLQILEKSKYSSKRAWVFVGVCAGLTFATKYIFILVLPALLLAFILARRTWLTSKGLLGFLFGAVAFVVPLIVWIHFQFGPNDSFTSILSFFANPYEHTFTQAFSVIGSNALRFFTETTPLYLAATFTPWVLSLALRALGKERISLAETTAFTFTILVLGAYLWSPGWYRYFFGAFAIILIFFPGSVIDLYTRVSKHLVFKSKVLFVLYTLLICLVGLHIYQLAFGSYVASYYGSARTATLEQTFSTIPFEAIVFLYNVPEVAVFLPSKKFYQYIHPHESQHFGSEELQQITYRVPDYIIVNADTYLTDEQVFNGYEVTQSVSNYVILSRI